MLFSFFPKISMGDPDVSGRGHLSELHVISFKKCNSSIGHLKINTLLWKYDRVHIS